MKFERDYQEWFNRPGSEKMLAGTFKKFLEIIDEETSSKKEPEDIIRGENVIDFRPRIERE